MMMPPQFRLPTKGMKRPRKDNPFKGTELEGKDVYFENNAHLGYNTTKKSRWNTPVYFIQSRDGEMFLINKAHYPGATVPDGLKPFFKDNKKRHVIRFDYEHDFPIEFYTNDKRGIWLFLCDHHPDPRVPLLLVKKSTCLAPLIDVLREHPNIDYVSFKKLSDELIRQHFAA